MHGMLLALLPLHDPQKGKQLVGTIIYSSLV